MGVYTTRNYFTARPFIKEVLNYCENEPKFIIDKAPWLRRAIESLGLEFEHEKFRKEEFVEAVFSSFKQRIKLFFCSITAKKPVKNVKIYFANCFVVLQSPEVGLS